jgi:hypothetical protein
MTPAMYLAMLGKWSVQPTKGGGAVVSSSEECGYVYGGGGEARDLEYYGGYLIAESITAGNAQRIAAFPKLMAALFDLRDLATSGSEEMGIIDEACKAAGAEPWTWPSRVR